MHAPFRKYVSVLLFSALTATAACSDRTTTGTASPTAPSAGLKPVALTVEPAIVVPEFVANALCSSQPAFRTSLVVVVGGQRDFILRSLAFSFLDRSGRSFFPVVMPTSSSTATQIPRSLPLPLPGTLTIPGSVGIQVSGSIVDGILVTGGILQRVPVVLEFGCATQASGDLVVTANTMMRDGSSSTPRTTVRIGSNP